MYEDVMDSLFKNVSVYSVENPSNLECKISDIAGFLSDKFKYGEPLENHLLAFIALSGAVVAASEAGVPPNLANVLYAPVIADAIVHANYFAVPRVKAVINDLVTENPYAGNGVPPASP